MDINDQAGIEGFSSMRGIDPDGPALFGNIYTIKFAPTLQPQYPISLPNDTLNIAGFSIEHAIKRAQALHFNRVVISAHQLMEGVYF